MKSKITFLSAILLLLSCSKKEETKPFPFESFIFSYGGMHEDKSIKFTKGDTVYGQKRFSQPTGNFYAIIKEPEKTKLIKLLSQLNYKKYDTVYTQNNLEDGQSFLLNFTENKNSRYIYIYGHKAPKQLYNFIDSIGTIKAKLKFKPTNKIIDFGDLKYILPPPPPPPVK